MTQEALAQPQQDSTCNNTLRDQGRAYPRTCKKCGLKPCIADLVQPAQPHEQEPVAWRVKVEITFRDGSVNVGYQLRNEKMSKHDEPLYTTPPPAATQHKRKPLTDEEIDFLMPYCQNEFDLAEFREFARAIEAAHGIKE